MGKPLNSVEKALTILTAFKAEHPEWGVRELATHLGLSPATVQRILQTLKSYGFVDQDPVSRQYRLGTVYYAFLHTLQSTYPITRAALPFMRQLVSRTQETVHINVIDGNERVCIDTVESVQVLKASMPIGSRSPLYAGASSKCLLAFSTAEFIRDYLDSTALIPVTGATITRRLELEAELELIRKNGYAASCGERDPGLGSISAPILNHRGVLLGAISLAIPEIRYRNDERRGRCLGELTRIALECSRAMGYSGLRS